MYIGVDPKNLLGYTNIKSMLIRINELEYELALNFHFSASNAHQVY